MKIQTPIDVLNQVFGGGFRVGEVSMICGDTGSGKTALMCDFAHHIALRGFWVSYVMPTAESISSFFTKESLKNVRITTDYVPAFRSGISVVFIDNLKYASRSSVMLDVATLIGLAQKHHVAVVCSSSKPRTVDKYGCASIMSVSRTGRDLKISVLKNKHGMHGYIFKYSVSSINLTSRDQEVAQSGGIEPDHSGETYNPYTGKWTFL
jgi:hypothetical protein